MSTLKSSSTHHTPWALDLGATTLDSTTVQFRVWAPMAQRVSVKFFTQSLKPHLLKKDKEGYWEAKVAGVKPGTTYKYVIDDELERPDPASRYQPEGVHGPSQIISPQNFSWNDQGWKGLPLEEYIIYELHVGTFTPSSTFDGVCTKLSYLRDQVGVTAIELLPVAQCPGLRNWGYDGTYLFAPQSNFGGPEGLKRLVDACHAQGLAVIMDVVYNHLGPEGNYLGSFGPYFTDTYKTPWGSAINYDGPYSDAVRQFIISNALFWVTEYHIDALRLDAIHGIFDFSAKHILQELGEAVHAEAQHLGRAIHVIAESDLNDSKIIAPLNKGGYGLDGQWSDDFHHALHCLLTKEKKGYYEDFGKLSQLVKAIKERFVYSGQYSVHRKRRHGNSAKIVAPTQFVVFSQNHDQVGNRAQGERLSTLIPFEALKVTAAAVLLSPNIPLLFMGEEYGETSPFLYFIDHGDEGLIEAVRQGRKSEFAAFGWTEVPDPYAQSTFDKSRLQWDKPQSEEQQFLQQWYHALIELRKSIPALGPGQKKDSIKVWANQKAKVLTIHRTGQSGPEALILLSLNQNVIKTGIAKPEGKWTLILCSNSQKFGGQQNSKLLNTLQVPSESLALELPPYAVWVYTNS
ncbi:malto-oligosyltrehalose trehalohydrolase [Candidatus Nitronereus thalassa]|uniref:Malto-oligosyltrehalose trehalohydrolase n=1 Tax=Candidatus Nitronereus thalassa TaxID=3020898 RepID=A0ABU3K5L4_9BACT|nr:malto-oligosyltrehalose trehalohydrolase [Candidatus Nitronereus thalassa]MDT7041704.1 malto-oligosyltrehalose trehalohydrolase [Candidatus Nitronereus thalassa]